MKKIVLAGFIFLIVSCNQHRSEALPFLGNPEINGKDTIYPTVANFSFRDQDSNIVNNQTFSGKIYVADFIFLSCPSICPIMTREMLKVYHAYEGNEQVAFISHTIDPERDTIPRLRAYAENLGVKVNQWHFVTGNQDSIRNLSEHSYFTIAHPDSTSPGGFTHSGGLLLIDKHRHIRGVYDGTNPKETVRLIEDIKKLLSEK